MLEIIKQRSASPSEQWNAQVSITPKDQRVEEAVIHYETQYERMMNGRQPGDLMPIRVTGKKRYLLPFKRQPVANYQKNHCRFLAGVNLGLCDKIGYGAPPGLGDYDMDEHFGAYQFFDGSTVEAYIAEREKRNEANKSALDMAIDEYEEVLSMYEYDKAAVKSIMGRVGAMLELMGDTPEQREVCNNWLVALLGDVRRRFYDQYPNKLL